MLFKCPEVVDVKLGMQAVTNQKKQKELIPTLKQTMNDYAKALGSPFVTWDFTPNETRSIWLDLHVDLLKSPKDWYLPIRIVTDKTKPFENVKRPPIEILFYNQSKSDQKLLGDGCTPHIQIHPNRTYFAIDAKLGVEDYIDDGYAFIPTNEIITILEYLQVQYIKLIVEGLQWTYDNGESISIYELLKNLNSGSTRAYLAYYPDREDKKLHYPQDMLAVLYINNHQTTPMETYEILKQTAEEIKNLNNNSKEPLNEQNKSSVTPIEASEYDMDFYKKIREGIKLGKSCGVICNEMKGQFEPKFDSVKTSPHFADEEGNKYQFSDVCLNACDGEKTEPVEHASERESKMQKQAKCIEFAKKVPQDQLMQKGKDKLKELAQKYEDYLEKLKELYREKKEEGCSINEQAVYHPFCSTSEIEQRIQKLKQNPVPSYTNTTLDCNYDAAGNPVEAYYDSEIAENFITVEECLRFSVLCPNESNPDVNKDDQKQDDAETDEEE